MNIGEIPQDVVERARAAFLRRFGHGPEWAACAPGRVNLIGEHTDYTGGFVLPVAIDRVCVAVGSPAADPALSRIVAADLGEEAALDWREGVEVGDGAGRMGKGSWLSYVAGVAAEFGDVVRGRGGAMANVDIAVASAVPVGSGLSSSAAVEVATATLLEAATGVTLEAAEKALLCQRAEHRYAGVPCGIMDQFVSVMGREGHALLIDCRSREATLVPVPPGAALVVIDTGVRHALASGEYAQRRAACEAAAARLGTTLRDAAMGAVERAFPEGDPLLPIARHVVSENQRTQEAAAALRAGNLTRLGRLMRESHASLRDDYRVSCAELDAVVDAAAGVGGVYGARMTGGGFGGCAIAVCAPGAVGGVEAAVMGVATWQAERACRVFEVRAGDGARVVTR